MATQILPTGIKNTSSSDDNITLATDGGINVNNGQLVVNDASNTVEIATALTVGGDITASSNVDIGGTLDITGNATFDGTLNVTGTTTFTGSVTGSSADFTGNVDIDGNLTVDTNTLFVDSTNNRVGVGTTSPLSLLHVEDSTDPIIYIRRNTTSLGSLGGPIWRNSSFNVASIITQNINANSADLTFSTSSGGTLSEQMRIDSVGRLLIGESNITSIPATLNVIGGNNTVMHTQTDNADSPFLFLSHARGTGTQSVDPQDGVGAVAFVGYDGANALTAARIEAFIDGTPGTNNMPGRLVFSTTPSGSDTPSEALRLTSAGNLYVGIESENNHRAPKVIVNAEPASQHVMQLSKGFPDTNQGYYYETSGKFFIRQEEEAAIPLVESVNQGTNINVVINVEFHMTSATTNQAGRVTGEAGFYRSGGDFTYWVNVPTLTMLNSVGYGAGTLEWTGSGNDQRLVYNTDSNTFYTIYAVTKLQAVGYDYCPINIL